MKPLILSAALVSALLVGCTATISTTPPAATPPAPSVTPSTAASTPAGASTVSCEYPAESPAAKEVKPPTGDSVPATGTAKAELKLNGKPIVITLDQAAAPCTVNSFLSLAKQSYYDGTDCHRLTTAGIFVLQCGDPTATGTGGPGYTIPDEFAAIPGYPPGVIAMANTGQPNSGGSQFFIVYKETPLPPQYTVFGTLDKAGLDQVKEIAAGGTKGGSSGDGAPKLPAHIDSIKAA